MLNFTLLIQDKTVCKTGGKLNNQQTSLIKVTDRQAGRHTEILPALKVLALQFLAHESASCSGVDGLITSCAETNLQTWSPSHHGCRKL